MIFWRGTTSWKGFFNTQSLHIEPGLYAEHYRMKSMGCSALVSTRARDQTIDAWTVFLYDADPNSWHSQQLRIVLGAGRSNTSQRPVAKDPKCRNISALCLAQAPGTQYLLNANLTLRFGRNCSCIALPGLRSSGGDLRPLGLSGFLLEFAFSNRPLLSLIHI